MQMMAQVKILLYLPIFGQSIDPRFSAFYDEDALVHLQRFGTVFKIIPRNKRVCCEAARGESLSVLKGFKYEYAEPLPQKSHFRKLTFSSRKRRSISVVQIGKNFSSGTRLGRNDYCNI